MAATWDLLYIRFNSERLDCVRNGAAPPRSVARTCWWASVNTEQSDPSSRPSCSVAPDASASLRESLPHASFHLSRWHSHPHPDPNSPSSDRYRGPHPGEARGPGRSPWDCSPSANRGSPDRRRHFPGAGTPTWRFQFLTCGQQRTTRDAVESAWVNCRIRGGHNLGAEPAANSSPIFFFKAKKTQTGSRRKISSLTLSFSSFYFHFKPPFQ